MLPLLKEAKHGKEVNVLEVEKKLISKLGIPEEEANKIKPSGFERLFLNRLRWAKTHLSYAKLIERTKTNCFKITPRGKQVLKQNVPVINEKYLSRFEEYREKRGLSIKFERRWCMPSKWTFSIDTVAEILDEEVSGFTVDPFSGNSKIGNMRNDLNPKSNATHHMDALVFLKGLKDKIADTILYDGIYSPYQQKREYQTLGLSLTNFQTSSGYPGKIKDEISRICKLGGKVISFGWNSNGMGKKRGFKITRIVLLPHGANHNDTILTVEKKIR